MIVIDSSAVIAMMIDEPHAEAVAACLAIDTARLLSAASYVEVGTVLAARCRDNPETALQDLDAFLEDTGIGIVPVDTDQARLALQARVRYGRGFGATARLNFGDCFSYALAKFHDAPLLYVGDDFARTDIASALSKD